MGGGSQRGDSYTGGGVVMMSDLQSRMSKKISQLARVIHHLNDRTGDDASSPTGPAGDRSGDLTDLVTVADRYDTEMEQILADAAAKVQGFHKACVRKEEESSLTHAVNALRSEHEAKCAAHEREMSKLRAAKGAAEKEAEERMKSMRFVLDEQKTNSGATIKELKGVVKALRAQVDASADVSALMTTHEHELSKQKSAHAEAIESVKAKHEELIELRVAEVTSRVTDEMKDLRAHVTEQKSLNKKLDGDLVRMRRDLENAHTESSDLRDKLASESQRADSFGSQAATSTQKAELEKKNLMEAMRESYAREKASLESEKAAYAREKEEAAALVIAERETTVRLVAERESLKTQLCTAQTTHTELEAALKDAERRLLETLAALESQKDEFNAKERADAETAETLRRMKEAQSDKETDFARLRTSLAESQATIASLNADIEGTHATHAREIERLNDELTAERTKVTSSARDVEELTKKLAQSESESVAFNQSAHTEKLQLQKRLEEVTTESSGTIAELTAEVSRLSALVDGAETNAAERMRREYESKFANLRTEHGKKLDSERRRFDSLVDANNKESAERLHRETEALRKTQAEMKKSHDDFVKSAAQDADKRVAKTAEEGQRVRNDLKMQIADLIAKLSDEQRLSFAAHEEKLQLTNEVSRFKRIAADATEKCDLAAKEFERKESELADKHDALKRQEELARRDRSDAVDLCEKLREDLAKQRRIVDEKEEEATRHLARELQRRDEEWTRRSADLIQKQLDSLSQAHAREIGTVKDAMAAEGSAEVRRALDESRAEFTAQASTLRAEIDAERDRTRDVQERAAKELNAVIEREKGAIIELRANHSFAMDRLKETKNAELAAAESKSLSTLSETNAKHAADTARMLDTHETALSDLKNSHEKALWDHTVDAETKLESVIDEWQSRHKDDTARLVAERWKQLCDLKESLGKDHSAALLERQAQWDAREEELTAMFTSAVAEAESLTEKLENAERNRDAFRMELEKLRETLEVTEDAARENAERMACERAEAESAIRGDHELTLASLESDRINETESLKREMEQRTKQADEAYADLLGWYEDVKRRFESRESRTDDLATIEHLRKVCSDKENEASEWRGHSEQMRLTLKNREGTFTQAAFGNGAATLKADAGGVVDWMLGGTKKKDKGGSAKRSAMKY